MEFKLNGLVKLNEASVTLVCIEREKEWTG